MSNEEIGEEVTEYLDDKIRDLSNEDYKEVLEIVQERIKSQLDAYEEDHQND